MLSNFYGRILNVNAAVMCTIDACLTIFVSLSMIAITTRLGMPSIGSALTGLILMLITITHSQTFSNHLVPLLKGLEASEWKYDSEVQAHADVVRGVAHWSVFAVICKAVFVIVVINAIYLWKYKYINVNQVHLLYILGYVPSLLGGWIAKTKAFTGSKKVH